ncbi:unnamed protein product [Notodromas monacha]|uniref:Ribosomal protein L9 domain-containing protein n=1 Tax=Notodromas monacha TaxID=399045 RepID=A0A7R9BPH8_9CRUS|nr:unnamed protein product [Notodromas monacha]CAG0918421.1 unnamed protein product [Notodromas monacha]
MNTVTLARFLKPISHYHGSIRSTWILKRKYEPYLSKLKTERPKMLRNKHRIYESVDNLTHRLEYPIEILLTENVEGLGLKGSIVKVKPHFARKELLYLGKGVYVTPENLAQYESKDISEMKSANISSPVVPMINKREKTAIRLRIEHYFKEIERRIPKSDTYWEEPNGEVFAEDKPALDELRSNYDRLAKEKVHERIKKLSSLSSGSELTDISIVKKLPCLEVLSLSVNSLSTLADLQNCKVLQELYIRKNNIHDLSEICYLKDLRKLKCLWLADNPCADHEMYRMTVLKHLPQIQKLDNVDVEPEEIREAHDRGLDLIHPLERQPGSGYSYVSPPQAYQANNSPSPAAKEPASVTSSGKRGGTLVEQPIAEDKELVLVSETTVQRLHISESKDSLASEKHYESPAPSMESYEYEEIVSPRRPASASAPPSRKPSQCDAGGGDGLYGVRRHSQIEAPVSYENQRMASYGVRRPSVIEEPPQRLPEEFSPPYQVDFSPEYNLLQMQQRQQQQLEEMRRQEELRRQSEAYHQQSVEQIEPFRNVNTSPTRNFAPRQKHRSSNILSAVLCLLKELDVRSLEVVEMSARGRIEELLED